MAFGTPSLGLEVARKPAPPPAARGEMPQAGGAARYDCGRFGWLTITQIAHLAGTSKTAIFKRIDRGFRGDELCAPRWARLARPRKPAPMRRQTLVLAFKIVLLFPDRIPSVEEIIALRPMSRTNAQTVRQALATARREAGLEVEGGLL